MSKYTDSYTESIFIKYTIISIVLLIVLFVGEKDLIDAIINLINSYAKTLNCK